MKSNTVDWILIAKGIGICLVVVGHFYPKSSPEYWSTIRGMIYSFHMPLFFLLSGYLYNHGKYKYSDFVKVKIKRLIYPFFSISAIFFLIKYTVGNIVKIEHPVDIKSVYALLTNPVDSYMPLLWFVYALFLIFMVYPLLRLYFDNFSLLVLFVVINSIIGTNFLVFGHSVSNIPFFILGVILREDPGLSKKLTGSHPYYIGVTLLLFIALYCMRSFFVSSEYFRYLINFITGVIGSLFVINLSHAILIISTSKVKDMMAIIGYYSMSIYLFHTLFESTVRISFIQVLKNVEIPFELIAFVAVFCGVLFPLILEKKY